MVRIERFMKSLEDLGEIGWEPGKGMNRPPFSHTYDKAREFVERLMKEAGMKTRVDPVGNLFGRFDGTYPGLPALLAGSHLDAVPEGGKYDGPLGVLGALEAARSLHEAGHRHPLEVVAFTAEEGGDMGGTFGSRSFAGVVDTDHLPQEDVMAALGISREKILRSRTKAGAYASYIELHIEQGPVLEGEGVDIGIPTAIAGITRYRVTVEGKPNHAGTTPMSCRCDAMRETAGILHEWYAYSFSETDFVSNIGVLSVSPGSSAIIPGKVEFVLELRSVDRNAVAKGAERMQNLLCSPRNAKCTMSLAIDKAPAALDGRLRRGIARICGEAGLTCREMPSGAMHDAAPVSKVMPAAMIFIPSVGGLSHSKEEYSAPKDVASGVEILARTLEWLDRE